MLRSISCFWSNAYNAFIFGHGPKIVTLANVFMLTSLRITGSLQPYDLVGKPEHQVQSVRSGVRRLHHCAQADPEQEC